MIEYADRIGADFISLNTSYRKRFAGVANYEKLRIVELLDQYDRLIYVDGDILISPDCPNLLDIVPADQLGAFVASRYSDFHNQTNIEIQKALGEIPWRREERDSRIFESFNSGVMVLSKYHLNALKQALPAAEVWSRYNDSLNSLTLMKDQPVLNYTAQKYQIPLVDLTYKFNHTNARGSSADRFASHIIHYAGTSHREESRLFATSKLTKMKIDAAIMATPWLYRIAKKSPRLVGLLDRLV
ncbi:MAG: glycosyltransferase [Cyanobium sp.]